MSTPEFPNVDDCKEPDLSWFVYYHDEAYWRDMFLRNRLKARAARGWLADLDNDQSPELVRQARVETAHNMLAISNFLAAIAAGPLLEYRKSTIIE